MRISDWSSDVCSSDLVLARMKLATGGRFLWMRTIGSTIVGQGVDSLIFYPIAFLGIWETEQVLLVLTTNWAMKVAWEAALTPATYRSEEHTSELQSLMRISYAVFCLKKKKIKPSH